MKGVKLTRTKAWQADRSPTRPYLMRFSTPLGLPPAIVPLSLLLLALALIGSTTTIMGVAAVAVFFLGGVLLWRAGESPILLFIFAYQWLQIGVAIFYCAPASSYVTGTVLAVDGGIVAAAYTASPVGMGDS